MTPNSGYYCTSNGWPTGIVLTVSACPCPSRSYPPAVIGLEWRNVNHEPQLTYFVKFLTA